MDRVSRQTLKSPAKTRSYRTVWPVGSIGGEMESVRPGPNRPPRGPRPRSRLLTNDRSNKNDDEQRGTPDEEDKLQVQHSIIRRRLAATQTNFRGGIPGRTENLTSAISAFSINHRLARRRRTGRSEPSRFRTAIRHYLPWFVYRSPVESPGDSSPFRRYEKALKLLLIRELPSSFHYSV